jgi:hypothetical protein
MLCHGVSARFPFAFEAHRRFSRRAILRNSNCVTLPHNLAKTVKAIFSRQADSGLRSQSPNVSTMITYALMTAPFSQSVLVGLPLTCLGARNALSVNISIHLHENKYRP